MIKPDPFRAAGSSLYNGEFLTPCLVRGIYVDSYAQLRSPKSGRRRQNRDPLRLGRQLPRPRRRLFIDLRDRYGKTQVVFEPESGAGESGAGQHAAQRIRRLP